MSDSIEDRLAEVEKEVQQIKAVLKVDQCKTNWISETKGCFRGDPLYAEIARLGKEIRDADRDGLGE